MIIIDLIVNLSLLVALSIVSGFIEKRLPRRTRQGVLLQGLLFGTAAVVGMLRPLDMGAGIIIDGRSVMVSLCALFFGPWAALPAVILSAACRAWLGGNGALTGVLVILSSAGVGLLTRARVKPEDTPPGAGALYMFGLVVHAAMILLLLFTLPGGAGMGLVMKVGLPILLTYPLATILAGKILSDQLDAEMSAHLLREHQERLQLALSGAGQGIIEWRLKENRVLVTQAVFEMLGYEKDEFPEKGRDFFHLLHADDRSRAVAAFNELLSEKISGLDMELRFRTKEGGWKWVLARGSICSRDTDGTALKYLGTHVDISGLKTTQENLKKRESYLQTVLKTTVDGFWTMGADQGILEANAAFCRMTGYTLDELRKLRISDIEAIETQRETDARVKRIIENGYEIFETRNRRKDGSHFDAEISVTFLDMEGGMFICFCRDITDRKQVERENERLQAQLHQSRKMEAVGRLAGGVSHDFNNMLGVMMSHLELLEDDAPSDHPFHDHLLQMRKAVERSADLSRQLLTFARKENTFPKVLDLNTVVESIIKLLRRLIDETIEIHWRPGDGVWPVRMDPSQVDQVLINLCVNARDAILGNGLIIIETGSRSFDETYCRRHPDFSPGDFAMLSVSDNGCGMTEETLASAFEPFFTTKAPGKGTGLGLATVYGIVKQNNGFIHATSEPDKGSTFRIYLPRFEGEAGAGAQEAASGPPEKGHGTILVVEDDPAFLEVTTIVLKRQGYTVLAADTPSAALFMAKDHGGPVDLLVTDVVLPEMSGSALAERLKTSHPDIKCLFMSGYAPDAVAEHVVLTDGVHFIQKPYSRKDLIEKVKKILEGSPDQAAPDGS